MCAPEGTVKMPTGFPILSIPAPVVKKMEMSLGVHRYPKPVPVALSYTDPELFYESPELHSPAGSLPQSSSISWHFLCSGSLTLVPSLPVPEVWVLPANHMPTCWFW